MFLADLFEVKSRDVNLLTNEELVSSISELCSEMNWQYDIDPLDEVVFEAGDTKLRKIEKYLRELFYRDKNGALQLWESSCPFAVQGMIPNFLSKVNHDTSIPTTADRY